MVVTKIKLIEILFQVAASPVMVSAEHTVPDKTEESFTPINVKATTVTRLNHFISLPQVVSV